MEPIWKIPKVTPRNLEFFKEVALKMDKIILGNIVKEREKR